MTDLKIINDNNMYKYFYDFANNDKTSYFNDFVKELSMDANGKNGNWMRNLTSYKLDEMYKTLRVVYTEDEVQNELCMIDDVLKILDKYIKIDGLDHMLINNYGAIENNIFFEHDSKKGTPKRIREHYKHQFRDAYLTSTILLDYGFLDEIVNCLKKRESLFAEYIFCCIEKNEENNKDSHLRKIVYKSIFISALFHDIGYPLEYFFRSVNQIHEYTPFFKIISTNIKTNFVEIRSILTDSLLFQCIDTREIEKKYSINDHGCLSAISFLLNYYYTGNIHKIKDINQCIIELSAISIYKHTNKYDGNNRMIFREDPMSYILRICDDLQEWDRFLLILNEKHNYLKCSKCGKLVINCVNVGSNKLYKCDCNKGFEKITDIVNKKMNYVNICDCLELYKNENESILNIFINYDYYKQIEIMLDDYTAVIYRDKGNKELIKLMEYQQYKPTINIQYFLSNNPILLIREMVKKRNKNNNDLLQFITEMPDDIKKKNMKEFCDIYIEYCKDNNWKEFGDILERDELRFRKKACEFILKFLGQIHTLKEWLYQFDEI